MIKVQEMIELHKQALLALKAIEDQMHLALENENLTRSEVLAILKALGYDEQ